MNHSDAVRVTHLSKHYRRDERRALDDVSFSLAPGRVLGVVGPNGAGKSTLYGCLLGTITPTSGTVALMGAPPLSPGWERRVGFSMLPSGLRPDMRVRDYLTASLSALGADRARADALLQAAELDGHARKRVKQLSTGLQQRLAITVARIGNPAVLLLDEPTNGLDVDAIRWVREIIRSHAAGGGAVMVTSHTLGELERLCDDLLFLRDGQAAFFGTQKEARATADGEGLEAVYDHFRQPAGEMAQGRER
ncbi:MAG: ABC transporter ATP-binding protein [Patulibacter sp.]